MAEQNKTPPGGAPADGSAAAERAGTNPTPATDDTLPAVAAALAQSASELGNAETVATPRSNRSGSGRAPVSGGGSASVRSGSGGPATAPVELGSAETISGNQAQPSPGGSGDIVRIAPGTLLGKRYRVGEHLGTGGMGTVHAGHDLLVDQAVALKFIRPSLASDYRERERLRGEVRLAQSVTHVNVARTYTLDEIDGHLFIVMELLRGPTLSGRLREGLLSIDEALRIARDLLSGLAAAHGRGILHRDIKPGNVKLAEDGRALLMDFGMARTSESQTPVAQPVSFAKLNVQITHTLLGGTPGYIAPEILRGKRGDVRADLYSFGVMLFELLTGRPPFVVQNPQELIVKHLDEVPVRVDSLRPAIPVHVADLVARLLEKDPEQRPGSADVTRRALLGPGDSLGPVVEPAGDGNTERVVPRPTMPTPTTASVLPAPAPHAPRKRTGLWIAAALVVVGGGVAVVATGGGRKDAPGPAVAPAPARTPEAGPDAGQAVAGPVAAPPIDAGAPVAVAAPPDAGAAEARKKSGKTGKTGKTGTDPGKTIDPPPPDKPPPDPRDDAAEKRRKQLELEQ